MHVGHVFDEHVQKVLWRAAAAASNNNIRVRMQNDKKVVVGARMHVADGDYARGCLPCSSPLATLAQ
jgi:hypothetical protein